MIRKRTIKIFVFVFVLFAEIAFADINAEQNITNEYVVLLHGLARSKNSMAKLEKSLTKQGYKVFNCGYPSRKHKVEKLAAMVIPKTLEFCRKNGAQKIHFVTHSLGGIILRYYLEGNNIPELGRVVMLSPPNKGSEAVDVLGNNPLFNLIYGPAGNQLGTDENGIPKNLGKVNFELGVITGRKSVNPFLSMIIDGEDDGKVSVKNSKVDGMKDFLVYDVSHPFIMRNKEVIKFIINFLKNGYFKGTNK